MLRRDLAVPDRSKGVLRDRYLEKILCSGSGKKVCATLMKKRDQRGELADINMTVLGAKHETKRK